MYHNADPKPERKEKKGKKWLKRTSLKKKPRPKTDYVKIYMDYFGYEKEGYAPCEIPDCGRALQDIHHISAHKAGGDPQRKKENIGNLMGLCREHHTDLGDKKQHRDYLINIHESFMENNGGH